MQRFGSATAIMFVALSMSTACGGTTDKPPGSQKLVKTSKSGSEHPAIEPVAPLETPTAAWSWNLPAGLDKPPLVPAGNPMSQPKVDLGHQLFMDKRLSVDGSRSCYSCHQNHLGNADGRKTALGPKNTVLPRNTPTIWSVAYHPALYWDGRSADLEQQAIAALKGGNMGLGDGLEAKAAEIGLLPEYARAFAEAFELSDGAKIEAVHVAQAISAYERTLLCGGTKWDTQEGMTEQQRRGQALFVDKAACITCHSGLALSDGLFHVTGVAIDPAAANPDVGRFKVTSDPKDKFAFRTPTMRNIARTAPYFHDGSVATLDEAVRIMATGGKPQAGLKTDDLLKDRQLSEAELADLIAFLSVFDCPGELEIVGDQSAEGIAGPT